MYRNWFYFRKTCSINKLRWKHVPDIFSCHLSDEKDGKPFWRCLDGGAEWLWGIAAGFSCWSFPGCSYFLGSNAMELLTCFSLFSSPVLGVCWREQERWIQNGICSVSAFWSGEPKYLSAINRPDVTNWFSQRLRNSRSFPATTLDFRKRLQNWRSTKENNFLFQRI